MLAGHANSQGQASRLTDYAAASNAYAVGAQGVLYHTYYPNPKRYPYDFETTGRIRFMGYPEILSHMDKTYRLTMSGWPSSIGRFAGLEDQLPVVLDAGEPGREVTLDVSDDLAAKADAGELWRCELRVLLDQRMHTDEVAVFWNDCEVQVDEHRWADWTYQLRPRPDHSLGYRLHVDLKKGLLTNSWDEPAPGRSAHEGRDADQARGNQARGDRRGVSAASQRAARRRDVRGLRVGMGSSQPNP